MIINNHKIQWLNRTQCCSYFCFISKRPAGCSSHYSHQDQRPSEASCWHLFLRLPWQKNKILAVHATVSKRSAQNGHVSFAHMLLTKPPWIFLNLTAGTMSLSGLGRKSKGASLVAQLVKNLPTMWETGVRSLGWEDPVEKGMATHSSILAWGIPWDRKESDITEWLSLR